MVGAGPEHCSRKWWFFLAAFEVQQLVFKIYFLNHRAPNGGR